MSESLPNLYSVVLVLRPEWNRQENETVCLQRTAFPSESVAVFRSEKYSAFGKAVNALVRLQLRYASKYFTFVFEFFDFVSRDSAII